ncbi:tubby C-terminal domain-like protein [Rossellomorea sp. H39__3]
MELLSPSTVLCRPEATIRRRSKRGYLKRYYESKGRFIIGEMVSSNWYVSMEIKVDGDLYQVKWYRERWFSRQEHWEIVRNGELIGQARTLVDLRRIAKLKEVIEFHIGNRTLQTAANTVTSTITVTSGEAAIGTLKRNHIVSNVSAMEVRNRDHEAMVALILHHFYFK